jgi:hypothetical protein
MDLPFVVETYRLALPDDQKHEAPAIVAAALARARGKHSDFDRFLPAVEHLAGLVFTDHSRLGLDDYLETLYCSVKHSDFARDWRASLKRPAVATRK